MGGLFGFLPGAAAAQTVLFEEDFESGWHGWFADNGVWQVGEATVGPVGSGGVAGTVLDGNYPYQSNSHLISPAITLPAAPQDGALWLRFSYWFNLHTSDGIDYGRVVIRTGTDQPWQILSGQIWGWSPYWSEYMADLAAYAGETVQIGILINDVDGGVTGHQESHGLYIDDVMILAGAFPHRTLQTFDQTIETDWEGWYADNGCWQVGELVSSNPPRSGRRCAATNLNGNYSYLASSRLISPTFDLPTSPADGQIWLSFWSRSSMHYADGTDYGQVQIQVAGGAWETLLGDFVAWASCWSPCVADLSAYAGQTVRVAFLMVDMDGGVTGHNEAVGWYVDDVAIKEGRRWLNNVEDCEGTITGWASRQGLWQMGSPDGGPGTAHSGERCWGTNLSGDYGFLSRSTLESTWIELPASPPVQLCFWHWFSFSSSDGVDYGQISVEHADGATVIDDISGTSGGWSYYCVDLSPYAGQSVRIRFRLYDVDGGVTGHHESSGWYIDDIEFNGLPTSNPPAPLLLDVDWSGDAPEINYFANPTDLEHVCIYYTHDADVIPDLSNRLAVLPPGFGSYVDNEHPGDRRYYHITGIDALGHESTILGPNLTSVEEPFELPAPPQVVLHGASPNPFNPRSELRFTMSQPAHVVLEVYDLRGRLVSRLRDEPMAAGTHAVPFADRSLASGAYLARLQVGEEVRTCKMMLTR